MKRKIALLLAVALVATTGMIAGAEASKVDNALALEQVSYTEGTVTATRLNVRQGPSTDYDVVGILDQGQPVQVMGKIGNWLAIFDPANGLVGAVDSKYLSSSVTTAANDDAGGADVTVSEEVVPVDIGEDEQVLLDLVNEARVEAGVGELAFDETLLDSARIKAQDMIENNYFSHQSPTYGSPFDMMRQYGVEFNAAGENIAGNESVEGAFKAWMDSDAHKKNILNEKFNFIGIGVAESKTYGKVLVQQFIGR